MNELIENIIEVTHRNIRRYANVPGAVIKSLSESTRNKLKNLKSDDLKESIYRQDWWQIFLSDDKNIADEQKFKEEKLKFDQKLTNKKE